MICFKNGLKLLCTLFVLVTFVLSDNSSSNIVQILITRPINIVSKEFVSFAIDPINLFEIRDKTSITIIASTFSPAYLKITGPSTNKLVLDNKTYPITKNELRFQSAQWLALDNWIRSVNLKPIFTLPYNEFTWKPKHILPILVAAEEAGIKDCIWQLGTNFNITDTISYVDDLATVGTMLSAFKHNKWSLIGADLSIESQVPEATLFSELSSHIVEANVWKQPYYHMSIDQTDYNNFMNDPIVRNLKQVNRPMWLTVPDKKRTIKSEICTEKCVINGLHWAQTLGSAAQNGFKVIFKTITENDILYPSLSYYIALIHKKVMGDKVFDSRIISGRDKSNSYFYTHCSRNISSSFTVMGINFGDTKIKAATKLPSKYTGSEVMQYILSVDKYGIIHINADPINVGSTIEPVMKVKRPSRPTTFSLPGRSVGFWIFPSANIKECIDYSMADMIIDTTTSKTNLTNRPLIEQRAKTASELLLQDLVVETIQRQIKEHTSSHLNFASLQTTFNNNNNKIMSSINKRKKRETYQKIITNQDINNQFADSIKSVKRTKNMLDIINAEKDLIAEQKSKSMLLPFKLAKLKILSNRLLKNRPKRQLMSKLFEKLDFMKPTKKLDLKPLFKLGSLSPLTDDDDDGFTKSTNNDKDLDKDNKNENDFVEDLFKSRENKDLPNGDIYFEVGGEQSNDYVAYTSDDLKTLKRIEDVNQRNNNKDKNNDDIASFAENDDESTVQKFSGQFFDSYHGDDDSRTTVQQQQQQQQQAQHHDDELYQPEQHIVSSLSVPIKNEMSFGLNVPSANIKTIIKEQQPTWQENQKNLKIAKESLQSMYFDDQNIDLLLPKLDQTIQSTFDDNIDAGAVSLASPQQKQQQLQSLQTENTFLTNGRTKRSINPNLNDEIQQKIDRIESSDTSEFDSTDNIKNSLNPNYFNRLNMLKKITRLVANLDQMDNKSYLNNINKLTDEIKEMENILTNKKEKMELFQPNVSYQRSVESMRKKCKILSMSLEHQCLQNNDEHEIPFLHKKTKRDAINKLKNKLKTKTEMAKIKNKGANKKKMTNSRNRRSLNNDTNNLSWEQDYLQSNMIHQEFNDNKNLNNVVPMIYERKHNNNLIYDHLHKNHLPTNSLASSNNMNHDKIWITKKDEQYWTTKSTVDKQIVINKQSDVIANDRDVGYDGSSSVVDNNNEKIEQFIKDKNSNDENYRPPRFMQSFTKTVATLMEAMNRHVSDWWNMMS